MRIAHLDPIRPGRCSSEPLSRISLLIEEGTKERLEDIADEQGVSVCAVIRACVNKCFGEKKQTSVRNQPCVSTKSQRHYPP